MAQLLSGLFLTRKVIREVKSDLSEHHRLRRHGHPLSSPPCMAIIETGENGLINPLIMSCVKFAAEVGMRVHHYTFSNTVTQEELLVHIRMLNLMPWINGIFIVLPIISTKPINTNILLNAVSIYKDICGLNSINRCRLANGDFGTFLPCMASACFELIKNSECKISGAHAVIYGRHMLMGMTPLGDMLKWNNATITMCHLKTENIKTYTRNADILVVAVGLPEHVRGNWIKPGAVVIDCGNNVIADPRRSNGQRTIGDVAFDEAIERAGHLTVIPNGITSLSIAILVQNVIKSYFFNR